MINMYIDDELDDESELKCDELDSSECEQCGEMYEGYLKSKLEKLKDIKIKSENDKSINYTSKIFYK